MTVSPSPEETLARAVEVTAELHDMLPSQVLACEVSATAKVPFKVHALRGAMLLRLHDLSDAACSLFQAGRVIPGMILARAGIETAALLVVLRRKLEAALRERDVTVADDFLERALGGDQYFSGGYEPYRVRRAMEHVEKEQSFVKDIYAWLSEHTHPNRLGGAEGYSVYYRAERRIDFEFNADEVHSGEGHIAIVSAIRLAMEAHGRIEALLPEFISLCERDDQL